MMASHSVMQDFDKLLENTGGVIDDYRVVREGLL